MASTSRPIVYYHFLSNKYEDEEDDEQNNKEIMNIDSNETTPKLHRSVVLFHDEGPWEIQKDLKKSDIGHLSRLLLSSAVVKKYIFSYWDSAIIEAVENGGIHVTVRDFDTLTDHQLVFRKWKSNGSYVFQENWSSQFVRRRNLQADDKIGMFWNPFSSFFVFKLISVAPTLLARPR